MSLPTIIAVIGAGSASFGENTLAALLRSKKLRGSTLRLVDRNAESLDIVRRLADRLNREWDAGFTLSSHASHEDALEGAEFVVSAIEVGPREELWRSDFEIPLRFGVRQPYAENGGPGGFIHAARNIGPVMDIVRAMETACPQAWFINYTNPMVRICDAVNRHSKIRAVGLCHQIYMGYMMIGLALAEDLGIEIPEGITGTYSDILQAPLHTQVIRQTVPRVDLLAAGLNHFTWALEIRDRQSGEDLYPIFRQRWGAMAQSFEPLTRRVFDALGWFPIPGDTHLCEYLPWVSDPQTRPWEKFNIHLYDWDTFAGVRDFSLYRLDQMAAGEMTIESLLESDSEGALEIIENLAAGRNYRHPAANLPNRGQIANLPIDAPVETPVSLIDGEIRPVEVGALPEPIAELCRREIATAQLGVDAAVHGDRDLALQCLLVDPVITDLDTARLVLDAYLEANRANLPQFWN